MNIKAEAYKLFLTGMSFKKIGDSLSISKTTAHAYVKEMKITKGIKSLPAANNELSNEGIRRPIKCTAKEIMEAANHPERSGRSEHVKANDTNTLPQLNIRNDKPKYKEFVADKILDKKFDLLNFSGKFLELIGCPENYFNACIWGLPKGGKSNLAVRLADYLNEYFGSTLYIACEEGEGLTFQTKIKSIGGSKMIILATKDREVIREYLKQHDFKYVFIDSINVANIDSEYLELLKRENPSKSFISIMQATKSGNFKGDQSLTHNCDFVIKVVKGVAYHEGRFGPDSEINIFDQPLYEKNPNKGLGNTTDNKLPKNSSATPIKIESQSTDNPILTQPENSDQKSTPNATLQLKSQNIGNVNPITTLPQTPSKETIEKWKSYAQMADVIVENPKVVLWAGGIVATIWAANGIYKAVTKSDKSTPNIVL